MTASPCPSATELARDPNVCPVCGHWCGKECVRRWAPRTVAELRGLVHEYVEHTRSYGKPLNKSAFDAWLNTREIA